MWPLAGSAVWQTPAKREPYCCLSWPREASKIQWPLGIVDDVVEVGQSLLLDEGAEDVDVAIGEGVGGEDVVVGNDDDLVLVPDLGLLAEFALEDADGARAADVVSEEHVGINPDVFAGFNVGLAAGAGEKLFGKSHGREVETSAFGALCHQAVFAWRRRSSTIFFGGIFHWTT